MLFYLHNNPTNATLFPQNANFDPANWSDDPVYIASQQAIMQQHQAAQASEANALQEAQHKSLLAALDTKVKQCQAAFITARDDVSRLCVYNNSFT